MTNIDKYLVSADICTPATTIARQLDIDMDILLEGLGIAQTDLQNPRFLLHTDSYLALLRKLIVYSDDTSVGLTAGLLAGFQALGILGLAILSAPTYKSALKFGIRYAGISGSIGKVSYIEEGDRAAFQVAPMPMELSLSRYLIDEQVASIYRYQVDMFGETYTPFSGSNVVADEIHFSYPEPENVERYRALFKCKLVFDAPYNRMWIGPEHLDRSLSLSNELAFEMCEAQCRTLLDERKEQDLLVTEVQGQLLKAPHTFPTIDEIASQVGLTGRSLRRRLRETGYSYTQLLENAKCGFAIDLLGNQALSIDEISSLLGYTEVTNFRRAFTKWKGISPSQYRKR